jgi:adenine/guanine/hypoxanthine permease
MIAPYRTGCNDMIERIFHLHGRGTDVWTELRGAFATFLTMAYILFANPAILSAAGIPFNAAVACTAAAAGICSILMGLYANFPIALASGMGLNAIVAYQATALTGSWQAAMGVVVVEGVLILILVLIGVREAVMDAIPLDLRRAIGAGIGLFIAFIGAVNAKLVIVPSETVAILSKNPAAILPPVTYGSLATPETAIALLGLVITACLLAQRVRGAIVLGILFGTAVALVWGVAKLPERLQAPDFSIAFQADLRAALRPALLPLIFALMMVDFFDTLGTATAIAEEAGIEDDNGRIPGLRRLLIVDSLSAALGGALGASSVTSYIESAAGVAEGARTGLHSVFVGLMFLLAIFAAPIAGVVPSAATAPALILVGFLMAVQITRIDFAKLDTAIPAFITLVTLPFTYSISHGIGYGFITYVAIHVLSGRVRDVHPLMYALAAAFAAYFVWGAA